MAKKSRPTIRLLVKQWLLADYYCKRPHALPAHLSQLATWNLIEAEERLRRAITGEPDLVRAAGVLGASGVHYTKEQRELPKIEKEIEEGRRRRRERIDLGKESKKKKKRRIVRERFDDEPEPRRKKRGAKRRKSSTRKGFFE